MPLNNKIKKTSGLSLIEILVTVLVVNFGVIGLTKLQFSNQEKLNNVILTSKASFYGEALVQKLYGNATIAKGINPPYVLSDFTDTPTTVANNGVCINSACDANTLAIYDINTWLHRIKNNFPKGKAKITKTDNGTVTLYTITIQWQYKSTIKSYEILAQL